MLGWLDVGNVSNSLGEASEQDMIRVSESMQKAAYVGGQIRDDQIKNSFLAQFLTFLFQSIQHDEIWAMAVELFSKPSEALGWWATLLLHEMVALFLPFYAYKAQELGLDQTFPSLHYAIMLSQESYMGYVHTLYTHYPFYQKLDKDTLATLVASLLLYHHIVVVPEGKTFDDVLSSIRSAV